MAHLCFKPLTVRTPSRLPNIHKSLHTYSKPATVCNNLRKRSEHLPTETTSPLAQFSTASNMRLNGKNAPKPTAYAPRNSASPTRTSPSPARAADPGLNGKVLHLNTDITTLKVDAIVNAAKQSLGGGAGVDGAIHKAAGPSLRRECLTLGGCAIGSAKITRAYNLPCQRVIHAVGPVYYDHSPAQAERFLRGCYRASLQLAVENGCKTVAFSSISTGIYGYPKVTATEAAISEVKSFLTGPDGQSIDKVIFCTFLDDEVTAAYNGILP
jgi:O-acetyl-ADP-ribose deacetylase